MRLSLRTRRPLAPVVAALLLAAPAGAQSTTRETPAIDPTAVEALRRMGAYLRTLKSFGVVVDAAKDEVSASGQKIQYSGTVNYLVRPPNALRAEIRTDRKQRIIYYDGKTLTVYAPRMHYFAQAPAPPTIMAMLDSAKDKFDLELPLSDLFTWGTANDGTKDLTAARLVGPAYVRGVDADQYAFRQPGADWQVWIKRGDTPLPLRLVITTTDVAQQPQYAASFSWNTAARTENAAFAFVPPRDAVKIRFLAQDSVRVANAGH